MTPSPELGESSSSSAVAFLDREEVIGVLCDRVAELRRSRPEIGRVVLFGSLVEGGATARSDADLLVVVEHADAPMHLRSAPYALALSPTPVPVDIFVRTTDELTDRFARHALSVGHEL